MIIDIINENIDNNNSVIQNEYKKLFNKLTKKYDDEELNRYSVDMFLADLKAFEKKPNNYDYPDANEFNKI